MQESNSITFERIRHAPVLHSWEIVLAVLIFAGLICFAIWRSRQRSKEHDALHLRGTDSSGLKR